MKNLNLETIVSLIATLFISGLFGFYPTISWLLAVSGINLIGPIMVLTLMTFIVAFLLFLCVTE